jgi:hypothetical protein
MNRRVLFLMLVLAGGLGTAQVFWRRPGILPGDWTRGYRAPVRLQEGRGEMELFAVEGSLAQIEHDLRQKHGEDLAWMPGQHVAWAVALSGGELHRYLIQPQPDLSGFWVVSMRQRISEAGRPGVPPESHQLRELPAFPQSQPSFFTHNRDTGTALEVSVTFAPPESVIHQLDAALQSDGWTPAPTNVGGMRMYFRRDHLAILSANRDNEGTTRVVRLHKEQGVR